MAHEGRSVDPLLDGVVPGVGVEIDVLEWDGDNP